MLALFDKRVFALVTGNLLLRFGYSPIKVNYFITKGIDVFITLKAQFMVLSKTSLPIMKPNPKNISVHDITVETLLGYITIRIDTTEFHDAASATPSKNLKRIV